jgi:hypothetical protein
MDTFCIGAVMALGAILAILLAAAMFGGAGAIVAGDPADEGEAAEDMLIGASGSINH